MTWTCSWCPTRASPTWSRSVRRSSRGTRTAAPRSSRCPTRRATARRPTTRRLSPTGTRRGWRPTSGRCSTTSPTTAWPECWCGVTRRSTTARCASWTGSTRGGWSRLCTTWCRVSARSPCWPRGTASRCTASASRSRSPPGGGCPTRSRPAPTTWSWCSTAPSPAGDWPGRTGTSGGAPTSARRTRRWWPAGWATSWSTSRAARERARAARGWVMDVYLLRRVAQAGRTWATTQ